MAFHFPFDPVLSYRRNVERRQEIELRVANERVRSVIERIAELREQLRQIGRTRASQLSSGTTAAEVLFLAQQELVRLAAGHLLVAELAHAQKARDQAQAAYRIARRDREILERLRDYRWREYEREAARREQQESDDLFLLRRAYRNPK